LVDQLNDRELLWIDVCAATPEEYLLVQESLRFDLSTIIGDL